MNQNKKESVAGLSILSNSFLVFSKLAIGVAIGSVSVISEAIHSALDLLAALIAWFAVRNSNKPPDKEHKFGHGKIENVSGFVEAILIFIAAFWIIYEAVHRLIYPGDIENIGLGIGIMLVSSVVNLYVSGKLMQTALETDSIALKADAIHLRTDIYTSTGVMTALLIIWLMGSVFEGNHFHWLDPLCAIAVALFIMKAAYGLVKESFPDLLDSSLPEEEVRLIEETFPSFGEIMSFKSLKTRKSGNEKFIEVDLVFDDKISLKAAHRVTDEVIAKVRAKIPLSHVTIHMEPCIVPCPRSCSEKCVANRAKKT